MKKTGCLFLVILCLFSCTVSKAGIRWYSFTPDDVPEELAFRVSEYTGTLRLTFLGDCTLGGEETSLGNPKGFVNVIKKEGYAYPFENLVKITSQDDLTIANLEGVLTDRKLPKTEKTFNFKGSADYTEILKQGSIECVSLANNHTGDYGRLGFSDTKEALDRAEIGWFSTDRVLACEINGVVIGFAGIGITLNGAAGTRFKNQVEALKKAGCSAIITVMHAGTEYDPTPNVYQRRMARKAAKYGSDLIVGHHPHVVQGYERIEDIPVVYSLGNCSFGGNTYPTDLDAVILQVELVFDESMLEDMTFSFYPISISGTQGYNNFRPELLEGAEAERVLKRMEKSTGNGFGPFDPETGARVTMTPIH